MPITTKRITLDAQTLIMESRECVIHSLQVEQVSLLSQNASLEDWLKASERERDEKEEALEECKAEIKLRSSEKGCRVNAFQRLVGEGRSGAQTTRI
jgi:hypothetical protein